jgi:serine/threonine protein phosphatase PrpC
MILKQYYSKTSKGPYLNVNEDLAFCDLENQIFFVLDGFGGSGIGDRAAELIRRQVSGFYAKTTQDQDSTMPFYYNFHYSIEMNSLVNALICSHRILLKENDGKGNNRKAGVTGAFVAKGESILNILTIGNNNCFLIRDDHIYIIGNKYKNFSLLSKSDKIKPFSSKIPMSAMGMYYHLDYEVNEVRAMKGDQVLIASDGLCDRLAEKEIMGIFTKEKQFEHIVEKLMKLNNQKGNKDNQSGIVLRF